MQPGLKEQLSGKHPLCILADKIDWQIFEAAFKKHYREDFVRPAKPVRLMTALLMLKHIRNLSDESVVVQWPENAYYQYFKCLRPKNRAKPANWYIYETLLCSPGMNEAVKVDVKISRETVLLLSSIIELG